jgi:hypothetical protein
MLPEPKKQKSTNFWTTLPGILTGCAALITAIAGLIAVLPNATDTPEPPTSGAATHTTSNSPATPSPAPDSLVVDPPIPDNQPLDISAAGPPISDNQSQAPELAGSWEWIHVDSTKVADISFSQHNGEYWGEVRYTNPEPGGAKQARMKGTFDGQTYTFVWWFGINPNGYQNNPPGRAFLNFADNGQTLKGRFTDDPSVLDKYPWELRRSAM